MLMIFLVAVFNTLDRTIIAVLVDDIKLDLSLSDRQMGFIMGLAFAVVHFIAGIPLARLADRWSRPRIVSIALFTWSVMTALGGMAQNFVQLALSRMGVGIGEAGGSPPSHAMLAEYVAPEKRARAMSLLTVGAIVGLGLGVLYGGWASQHYGWRFALISVGVPGAFLALLFGFTVRDYRKSVPARHEVEDEEQSLRATLTGLLHNRAFVFLTLAACMVNVTAMGRGMWEPTFLRRVYEMSAAEAGAWYFITGPVPTAVGALVSGVLIDRLARRDSRWYGWAPALASLILIPLSITFYLYPTDQMFFALMPAGFIFSILVSFFAAFWAPATMALAQRLVSGHNRAVAAASWSMLASLVGTGLGPLIVGDLNARLAPQYGDQAVRYSLLLLSLTPLLASWFYWHTARELGKLDLQR